MSLISRLRPALAALALSFLPLSAARAQEPVFVLREIAVPPSDYLTQAEIRQVTSAWTGHPVTFRDVQQMVAAVQKLYVEAGVPTAQVILPPQDIRDGVLRLGLVEAKIEAVKLVNNPMTRADFLTKNLTLPLGGKPDYTRIEQDLRIFALAHDIRPTLDFRPGQTPGSTIVTIDPQEPGRFSWSGTLDNYGRKDTGRLRAGLNFRLASLSGWRDTLSASLTATDGSWQGNMVYDRPMGRAGGHGYLGAYTTNASVIGGSLSDADLISDGRGVYVGYRFPFAVQQDRSLNAAFGLTWDHTTSSIAGVEFADTTLSEFNAQLGLQRQMPLMQLAGSVSLHFGRARNARSTTGSQSYGLLRVNGSLNRMITTDLGLSLDLNAQFSPERNLPVARQFSVGGPSALRGYPSDVRAARSGMMVRMQLNKLKAIPAGPVSVQPFGFVDAAVLMPWRADGRSLQAEDKLLSVGLGAQVALSSRVGLTASIGTPLRDTNSFKGKGDPELYLGLSAKF